MPSKTQHIPVLTGEVLQALEPSRGESYLDVTAGYGGHAEAVLARTQTPELAVLIDRDKAATEFLKQKFGKSGPTIVKSDFLSASSQMAEQKKQFDMVLADLGASSPHFDDKDRGFSFNIESPLDMRMDTDSTLTADDIVNGWDEPELKRVIAGYGEEKWANRIARAIIAARPIATTTQLAELVTKVVPGGRWQKKRIHPATKTFQALRIAVNGELEQLEQALPIWLDLLSPGGRLAVISFHSLEDRIVKRFLQEHAGNRYDAVLKLLSKKPVTARPQELVSNPRARSAKLRAAAKIKTKKER